MFDHTVVAAHFASASAPLFQSLQDLRERGTREITLVDVLQYFNRAYSADTELGESNRTEARQRLEDERAELERAGFKVNIEVRIGQPAHELCAIARARKAGLILVGTRGESSFREFLRGSTVLQVIRKATTPVLIETIDPDNRQIMARGLSDILLATDFSHGVEQALSVVIGLAEKASRIILLHVVEDEEREEFGDEEAESRARVQLQSLAARIPIESDKLTLKITQGSASREIKRVALEAGVNLVVIGKRGQNPIPELTLGSTAQAMVKGARQSILMVPFRRETL